MRSGVNGEDAPFDGELVLFATDDPDAVLTSPATLVTEQGKLSVLTPLEPLRPLTTSIRTTIAAGASGSSVRAPRTSSSTPATTACS